MLLQQLASFRPRARVVSKDLAQRNLVPRVLRILVDQRPQPGNRVRPAVFGRRFRLVIRESAPSPGRRRVAVHLPQDRSSPSHTVQPAPACPPHAAPPTCSAACSCSGRAAMFGSVRVQRAHLIEIPRRFVVLALELRRARHAQPALPSCSGRSAAPAARSAWPCPCGPRTSSAWALPSSCATAWSVCRLRHGTRMEAGDGPTAFDCLR